MSQYEGILPMLLSTVIDILIALGETVTPLGTVAHWLNDTFVYAVVMGTPAGFPTIETLAGIPVSDISLAVSVLLTIYAGLLIARSILSVVTLGVIR